MVDRWRCMAATVPLLRWLSSGGQLSGYMRFLQTPTFVDSWFSLLLCCFKHLTWRSQMECVEMSRRRYWLTVQGRKRQNGGYRKRKRYSKNPGFGTTRDRCPDRKIPAAIGGVASCLSCMLFVLMMGRLRNCLKCHKTSFLSLPNESRY